MKAMQSTTSALPSTPVAIGTRYLFLCHHMIAITAAYVHITPEAPSCSKNLHVQQRRQRREVRGGKYYKKEHNTIWT